VNAGAPADVAPGHKPPVLDGWSGDLSYAYYARLVKVLLTHYQPVQMRDARLEAEGDRPRVIMRHDIDVCPRAALRMAQLEQDLGLRSTYFFLVNSPLYTVHDPETADILRRILGMGHEVALHFDLEDELRIDGCSLDVVEAEIAKAAELVQSASGDPVRSVSFHRPIDAFLRGPMFVAGLVNAYARELMAWYLSDSNACWREGEPIPMLLRPRAQTLQILVHPIWWGETHMRHEDRLSEYCREQKDPAGDLDARIFRGIGLRRRGG
jgi:hypothetical protein